MGRITNSWFDFSPFFKVFTCSCKEEKKMKKREARWKVQDIKVRKLS